MTPYSLTMAQRDPEMVAKTRLIYLRWGLDLIANDFGRGPVGGSVCGDALSSRGPGSSSPVAAIAPTLEDGARPPSVGLPGGVVVATLGETGRRDGGGA